MPNNQRDGDRQLIAQMSGLMEGLTSVLQPGGPMSLQQGRVYGGGAPDGKSLCDCAVMPSHCFRTVSQRSLSVPTRFLSELAVGPPNLPAGADIFDQLFTSANGCLGDLPVNGPGIFFNQANVNNERQRVYDLVLIAVRSEVTVLLADAEAVGAGAINVSSLQQHLEDMVNQYIQLRVYHSSDLSEPWIGDTNLGYFQRPRGEFQIIPPVMWIDRDPSMELRLAGAEKGGGAGAAPDFALTLRDLDGTASIVVECLFIPDPYNCPDTWPGELCPRDMIGNTKDYKGSIKGARVR